MLTWNWLDLESLGSRSIILEHSAKLFIHSSSTLINDTATTRIEAPITIHSRDYVLELEKYRALQKVPVSEDRN